MEKNTEPIVQIRSQDRLLDARIESEKLRKLYANDEKQSSFRLLLTGETGTGKTNILRTARRPVHIDSFDPGGTKPLRDLILKGDIVADTIYESENRESPSMFREWSRTFEGRVRGKYFESFGTYVLDSSTLWAESIMNWILGAANIAGQAPRFTKDYTPQKVQINNWMKRILDLPCDVIVTGHLQGVYESKIIDSEEVRVLTGMRYMTTGQGAIIIPLLFDELWVTDAREKGTGTEYSVITAKYKLFQAKTRIGREKFNTIEKPDIKYLLEKAGWASKDKEKLY